MTARRLKLITPAERRAFERQIARPGQRAPALAIQEQRRAVLLAPERAPEPERKAPKKRKP